jgi:hypothetical protein
MAQGNASLFDPIHHCLIIPVHNLFSREPCRHVRREIPTYLDSSKSQALHHAGRNYLASMLSTRGFGSFFTQQFFQSLINIGNRAMNPHATLIPAHDLATVPALHIYDFFAGVQSILTGQALIPAAGLSLIQAHHVGALIFHSPNTSRTTSLLAHLNPLFLTSTSTYGCNFLTSSRSKFSGRRTVDRLPIMVALVLDSFVYLPEVDLDHQMAP